MSGQSPHSGKLIVIVGPSGAGKSSLIEKLREDVPTLSWSISSTTRLKRPGETNGVHYFFLTDAEFDLMIKEDQFIEWFQVHGHRAGTSRQFVESGLAAGQHLLFDIDVQGALAVKAAYSNETFAIFVAPPSIEILEERLTLRGSESSEKKALRLKNAKEEMKFRDSFDALVVNDEFESAYRQLFQLVKEQVGQSSA